MANSSPLRGPETAESEASAVEQRSTAVKRSAAAELASPEPKRSTAAVSGPGPLRGTTAADVSRGMPPAVMVLPTTDITVRPAVGDASWQESVSLEGYRQQVCLHRELSFLLCVCAMAAKLRGSSV